MNTPRAIEGCGNRDAESHSVFVAAYQIIKDDRGTTVTGAGPDGKCTGTCDRCGTAILNIYVFATPDRLSYMHVGIDCAQKMGVPMPEIKRARTYWRDQSREAARAVARATAAERRTAEEAEKRARLAENAAFVAELEALRVDPRATDWESSQLGAMIATVGLYGADWADESNDDESVKYEADVARRATLACIRDRLSLCDTSRVQSEDTDKKGKTCGFRRVLRAYRKPVVLSGQYGTTYISFLTDDRGNAYVHKGSNVWTAGETVEATWSIDGSDERDGLTATRIKRPRKIAKTAEEIAATAQQELVAAQLESDRAVIATTVGVSAEAVHYANAYRGLYVVEVNGERRAYQVCPFDERPLGDKWAKSEVQDIASRAGLVLWQSTR